MDLPANPALLAGRYRLIRPLAKGGMGELFLAVTVATEVDAPEKFVAVKRILPQYAADPEALAMFLNEGKLTAKIVHPNVVRVHDMGRTGDTVYYAMEYLHGVHLGQLLAAVREAGRTVPLAHVVAIAQAICAGLHCAHEMQGAGGRLQTIVHRDVSPGNIFVTYAGEIKLVDFGIAKALASTKITVDGLCKGKAQYMSPEQCMGDPIDRRSDLFSLGTVMYEMLTLTRPFTGENEFAVMNHITRGGVPPPSARRPDLPPMLERIVLRTLASDPNARYPTALALSMELARFARVAELDLDRAALVAFLREQLREVPYPVATEEDPSGELSAALQRFGNSGPMDAAGESLIDDLDECDDPTQPGVSRRATTPGPVRAAPRRPLRLAVVGFVVGVGLAVVAAYGRSAGPHAPDAASPAPPLVADPPAPPPPAPPPLVAPPAAPQAVAPPTPAPPSSKPGRRATKPQRKPLR
jgi:serine/threonine protein kinase